MNNTTMQIPVGLMSVEEAEALICRAVRKAICQEKELIARKEVEEKASVPVEEYLSRMEVAKLFGVDQSTLWRWNKDGLLTRIKVGSKVVYARSTIEQFAHHQYKPGVIKTKL